MGECVAARWDLVATMAVFCAAALGALWIFARSMR